MAVFGVCASPGTEAGPQLPDRCENCPLDLLNTAPLVNFIREHINPVVHSIYLLMQPGGVTAITHLSN